MNIQKTMRPKDVMRSLKLLTCVFTLSSLIAHVCNAVPMTFFVTTTADSGPGSLRQAILNSNANNPSPGVNTISFAGFSGTITPLTTLPSATMPVLIDGYTAAGASPNTNGFGQGSNAVITVEIKGPGAGVGLPVTNGLVLNVGSDGSTIRGLSINNFANVRVETPGSPTLTLANGIVIVSNNNTITGNFIGLDTTGVTPFINCRGIFNLGNNNTIGGATPDLRNVIVGGAIGAGEVIINEGIIGTLIAGNLIGLTKNGDVAPITGTNYGILTVGGELTIDNNVIAGHSAANIFLIMIQFAPTLFAQTITNNLIGTDVTGQQSITPQGVGIITLSTANLPGTYAINNNIVSGNTYGILLGQNGYVPIIDAYISGNFIGTDSTGSFAIPNTLDGILIDSA